MSFLTQLLPGLRDVRAPLIAGYLWLLAGWLIWGRHLPGRGTTDVYAQLFEAGDAVGRVVLLAALSIAAYLLGSLFQAIPSWVTYNGRLGWRMLRRVFIIVSPVSEAPLMDGKEVLNSPHLFAPKDFRYIDGDRRTGRVLDGLVNARLAASRQSMDMALKFATKKLREGAEQAAGVSAEEARQATVLLGPSGHEDQRWTAAKCGASVAGRVSVRLGEIPLPNFSAARDIFDERAAIQTRLLETTKLAGSEVERLYSESDFRLTIALPLAAVALVMTAKSGDNWWVLLFVAVLGLLLHAVVLRKHAGRELAEGLRSRPDESAVDQITPVFLRYEATAEAFNKAIRGVDWTMLGRRATLRGEGTDS